MRTIAVNESIIDAIIAALDVPRNRAGKLIGDAASGEPLRKLAVAFLPTGQRGALDSADQVVKVLRAIKKQPHLADF